MDGNVYQVDAFVQIVTKNVQTSASGIDTTATYKLTIDKDQGWKITAITSNGTNFDADGASPEGNNTEGNNAGEVARAPPAIRSSRHRSSRPRLGRTRAGRTRALSPPGLTYLNELD